MTTESKDKNRESRTCAECDKKGVFFDLDGTLLYTLDVIVDVQQQAWRKFAGREVTREQVLQVIGIPIEKSFPGYEHLMPEIISYIYEISHDKYKTNVGIYLGIYQMLERLRKLADTKGFVLGVVTSRQKVSTSEYLGNFDLLKFFDLIVSAEDTEKNKPDPEPLLYAALQSGISDLQKLLYVGDSIHDLRCAKSAGAIFGMVAWTSMPKEQMLAENPDILFERPQDVADFVANNM